MSDLNIIKSDGPAHFRFRRTVLGRLKGDVVTTFEGALIPSVLGEPGPAIKDTLPATEYAGASADWIDLDYLQPVNMAAQRLVAALEKEAGITLVGVRHLLAQKRQAQKERNQAIDRHAAEIEKRLEAERLASLYGTQRDTLAKENGEQAEQRREAEARANRAHRRAQHAEGQLTRLRARYNRLVERITNAQKSPRATLEGAMDLMEALADTLGHAAGLGRGPVSGPIFDALKAAVDESLARWLQVAHFAQPAEESIPNTPIPYKLVEAFRKLDAETAKRLEGAETVPGYAQLKDMVCTSRKVKGIKWDVERGRDGGIKATVIDTETCPPSPGRVLWADPRPIAPGDYTFKVKSVDSAGGVVIEEVEKDE